MLKLTIDFETRSEVSLKDVDAWKYSEHPSTEALCLAIKVNDEIPKIWIWDKVAVLIDIFDFNFATREEVEKLIELADVIEGHNVGFEYAIWTNVLVRKYGWKPLPVHKLQCSMAKTMMCSLPGKLEVASKVLLLTEQKDMVGHKIMQKLCKPRRRTASGSVWWEDPKLYESLFRYCIQDVNTEHALSEYLDDLPEKEKEIWQLDLKINARGIMCDTVTASRIYDSIYHYANTLRGRCSTITKGIVNAPEQVAALLNYIRMYHGVAIKDLSAATVRSVLNRPDLPPEVRELLQIRQAVSKTSTVKFRSYVSRACKDERIRSCFMYHGASTGRWAGRGIQPQNLPRAKSEEVDILIRLFNQCDIEGVKLFFSDDVMTEASKCLRGMLISSPDKRFICADFNAIEGRGLAWLAGEDSALNVYQNGIDPYKIAASIIYGTSYEEVKSAQRTIGKVAELACGYAGGVAAYMKMAKSYKADLAGINELEVFMNRYTSTPIWKVFNPNFEPKDSLEATALLCYKTIKGIIDSWRANRPMTTRYWAQVEAAVRSSIINPGKIYEYRNVKFLTRRKDNFLLIRLPSGRKLYYYAPQISPTDDTISYMGVESQTKQWLRIKIYGGKFVENITQAVCRDLMAEAMLRLEASNYPIVLHVHDEIVAEVPEYFGSLEDFIDIMCFVPEWAKGFPIAAEGWVGKRYKK